MYNNKHFNFDLIMPGTSYQGLRPGSVLPSQYGYLVLPHSSYSIDLLKRNFFAIWNDIYFFVYLYIRSAGLSTARDYGDQMQDIAIFKHRVI